MVAALLPVHGAGARAGGTAGGALLRAAVHDGGTALPRVREVDTWQVLAVTTTAAAAQPAHQCRDDVPLPGEALPLVLLLIFSSVQMHDSGLLFDLFFRLTYDSTPPIILTQLIHQ